MPVVFDASILIPLFDATANVAPHSASRERVERVQDRLAFLIQTLERDSQQIVVPTPALTELLIGAGEAASGWLAALTTRRAFRVVPYDLLAAVEAAEMLRQARAGVRAPTPGRSWQQVKFDHQIVAIARVVQAQAIYSDDRDIFRLAGDGIPVISIAELPLPPEPPQLGLPGLDDPK